MAGDNGFSETQILEFNEYIRFNIAIYTHVFSLFLSMVADFCEFLMCEELLFLFDVLSSFFLPSFWLIPWCRRQIGFYEKSLKPRMNLIKSEENKRRALKISASLINSKSSKEPEVISLKHSIGALLAEIFQISSSQSVQMSQEPSFQPKIQRKIQNQFETKSSDQVSTTPFPLFHSPESH